MKNITPSQYTIRGIHPKIDKTLREYAKRSHRSLNTVTLEAIQAGLGIHSHELKEPESQLTGLAALKVAKKLKPIPFDANKPIKQLYRESIAKKYGSSK